MTLNGTELNIKGKNTTIAEVFSIIPNAQSHGKKLRAVLPSWNRSVTVELVVPRELDVVKGSRLLVEANLGALYVDELRVRYVSKAS